MTEDQIFKRALEEELIQDIRRYEELPKHRFSFELRRKMKKLMSVKKLPFIRLRNISFKKAVSIAVAVAFISVLSSSNAGINVLCGKYKLKDYGHNSVFHVSNREDKPKVLKEKYAVTVDVSCYERREVVSVGNEHCVIYKHKESDKCFAFSQSTFDAADRVVFNTENAIIRPEEVTVGDNEAFYFTTYLNETVLTWECGDYYFFVMSYGHTFEEILDIAESIEKVR